MSIILLFISPSLNIFNTLKGVQTINSLDKWEKIKWKLLKSILFLQLSAGNEHLSLNNAEYLCILIPWQIK